MVHLGINASGYNQCRCAPRPPGFCQMHSDGQSASLRLLFPHDGKRERAVPTRSSVRPSADQDDDKIAVFTMDARTGQLTPQGEVLVLGGPSPLTMSPDRKVLYVGQRTVPGISSFRIDPATGALTPSGTVAPEAAPTFLSTDRTGRYVLSAYYQGAHAAVHPVGHDGAVGGSPIAWVETAIGAHAIQTDPSNTFAFVPHIDNRGGPNAIFQFKFDPHTGHLTPNSPPRVGQPAGTGPRHFCFHPSKDILYFSNEQGSSVTGYHLGPATGTLSAFQTISTLPTGYERSNTCS